MPWWSAAALPGAASRLGLSAVMVGNIAQLEANDASAGARTRRQASPDAGRVYFDEAKRVMSRFHRRSAVERLRLALAGTLR